ncbi:mCG3699, isoform CRA_b [Mus musculus]|uniref:Transmembrane protein 255B n=1 Tax=Mus musculus TaxID=10090 RepID=A0A1B0GRM2_MOUSE|nr:mCG3699, isoform CRA_b [Mus musculus]
MQPLPPPVPGPLALLDTTVGGSHRVPQLWGGGGVLLCHSRQRVRSAAH